VTPEGPSRDSLGTHLLRAALRVLPEEMRERDGAEIEALFAEESAAAQRGGIVHHLAFIVAAVWDISRRAPYDTRRRGRHRNEDSTMRSFYADLRFAIRSFTRQPGPTALIVLTLTLGIAANTAVFAIVDGLFLRPFPFPDPGRLVYLNERAPTWNLELTGINYPDFHTWRERASAFESMSLWSETSVNLADASGAERVDGLAVTYDFPKTLGIRPLLGRTFTREEDGPTPSRVVMIGYGLWQTRFAGSRDVVGQPLRINSRPYTIIGVLPREAAFPGNMQFWVPLNGDPNQNFQSYGYEGIARLKPGVTIEQARTDLMRSHAPIWAATDSAHTVSPRLDGLREQFVSNFRAMGKALGAGALLVLLIACANVAGAMLARSIFRRREIAIRLALGASARRVGRQLITESLALSVVAGVAGTVFGRWLVHVLATLGSDQIPPWVQLQFGVRTIVFAVLVSGDGAGVRVRPGATGAASRRHGVARVRGCGHACERGHSAATHAGCACRSRDCARTGAARRQRTARSRVRDAADHGSRLSAGWRHDVPARASRGKEPVRGLAAPVLRDARRSSRRDARGEERRRRHLSAVRLPLGTVPACGGRASSGARWVESGSAHAVRVRPLLRDHGHPSRARPFLHGRRRRAVRAASGGDQRAAGEAALA
jgi:hypothetical protein